MMKILLVCALSLIPDISSAHEYGCASVGASIESSLFDAISKDLEIDASTIQRDKTEVDVIDISPVSKIYAESLAEVDYADSVNNGQAVISYGDYFSSYYGKHAKNITAKYIYVNPEGERDTFIASGLVNNDECSIRFNGYITLSREF